MSKVKNVLVAGANGTTGRIIIDLLKESKNYQPIAMVRKQEQKDHFEKENVMAVMADLEEDLDHAMKNTDKVIFAAGSKGKNVIGVDQEGAKKLTDAAMKAGITKFVMLSSMGADKPSVSEDLKDYLIAKQNADDHLRVSGLNYSIVRPGSLTDDAASGKIQLQEKFENQGSISRADVAKTLVEVLDDDVKKNQIFEILSGETPIEKAVRS
ncbi:SDR family oxidoreductase [Gillisia sp. CAL575]|uniref:SDR family oxidoreductase n=1 Tax=Gillisia sp. CAL575 TaxID=985255 RepID=UPI0009FD8F61|nr:SDR family oxidoreductase [Gillisia sp. CAL575]